MPVRVTKAKSRYRPEIDGLRAFAVIAVIINHFNKDLLPSGYLGVDIFFVISGYVITSSLAGRESKNFLDFLTGFYERRIKRLVPALVVFVLITSVLISFFNSEPGVALGLGWRSLFGVSNINLYRSATDYFAESTELNPFTHTWSLGVEEQFYLLFPFLIWFSGFGRQAAKGARNLFFWVGALTVASLISFIYLYQVNQPAAYFLMPPRFWEMAAGCLIFIGFQKRARIEQALEQVSPLLVVAAMVGVMFLPESAAVPATISVVLLSAILVACLKQGTAAYKFFTLEKVVYVGLISYSLYLWHWSVLSISRWTIGIHWWSVPIQAGLMLLLATGSYRFIETSFRGKVWFPEKWKTVSLGIITAFLTAVGLMGFSRASISRNIFLGVRVNNKIEWKRMGGFDSKCLSVSEKCLQRPARGDTKKIFFWIGDSHTRHFLPLAKLLTESEGVGFISYQSGGDAFQPFPTIDLNRKGVPPSKYKKERENMNLAYQQIAPSLSNGDAIVISLNLPRYFEGDNGEFNEFSYILTQERRINAMDAFSLWLKKLGDLASDAQKRGVNVIVAIPTPHFPEFPGLSVCVDQPFRPFVAKECLVEKNVEDIYGNWSHIVSGIKQLSSVVNNLFVFDPRNSFCGSDGRCRNFSGRTLLFMDGNHLRKEGTLLLYPEFSKFLKSNNLLQ
ncbi:MAG: acyltransferase [Spirochaeta sp.]|nr:acyltransferase [Spirochaeta sp.]